MLPFISSLASTNRTKHIRARSITLHRQLPSAAASGEQPHQETMTSSCSAPLLVLALLAIVVQGAPTPAAATVPVDTVADSCDAIRDFVDYAFCATALRSGGGPNAPRADRHAHLLVAADLAAARGASARDAAQAMARSERDPAARDGLEACGILYGATSVPALRFMRGYAAARAWDRARPLLALTGQAGIGCEAALGGASEAKGRMAAANREFDQLSTMATALLNKVDHIG